MSPILESLGQPAPGGEEAVSAAYWAGVQTPRPAPREGLIVIPSGRATTAFLIWDGARPPGFGAALRRVDVEVEVEAGRPRRPGRWSGGPDATGVEGELFAAVEAASGSPASSRLRRWVAVEQVAPGCCQESALAVKASGAAQEVGRVR